MCIGETFCGKDSDEVFAYATPAVVKIKDRKLGLAKLFFQILAFIWIVINNVFLQKGWAKTVIPTGVVRLSPLQPKINAQGVKEYVILYRRISYLIYYLTSYLVSCLLYLI